MADHSGTEIEVDEEVIQKIVDTFNNLADHLDELAKTGVQQYDTMHDELKWNGKIPPVYQDIAGALHSTSTRFTRVNAQLVDRLRHDAAALLHTVQRHADIQTEAANDFHDDVDSFASAADNAAGK